jgi:hypothetical protein
MRAKPHRCLKCSALNDAVTAVGHRDRPTQGSISVCAYCGHIAQFGKDGQLEEVDLANLKKHMEPDQYRFLKVVSAQMANRFYEKNGFYASDIFELL